MYLICKSCYEKNYGKLTEAGLKETKLKGTCIICKKEANLIEETTRKSNNADILTFA